MKSLVIKITTTAPGLDTVPVRIGAGIIFAAHGAQKLLAISGFPKRQLAQNHGEKA